MNYIVNHRKDDTAYSEQSTTKFGSPKASIAKRLYGDSELVCAYPNAPSQKSSNGSRHTVLFNSCGRKSQHSVINYSRMSNKDHAKNPQTSSYYHQGLPNVRKNNSKLDGKTILGDVNYTKKCSGKTFAVIQVQSLVEAADKEYQKSKLESRTITRQSHQLELCDVLKWTMYDIRGGLVTDWLAGKSRARARKSTTPQSDDYSCLSLNNNHSRSAVKSSTCSVYNIER